LGVDLASAKLHSTALQHKTPLGCLVLQLASEPVVSPLLSLRAPWTWLRALVAAAGRRLAGPRLPAGETGATGATRSRLALWGGPPEAQAARSFWGQSDGAALAAKREAD